MWEKADRRASAVDHALTNRIDRLERLCEATIRDAGNLACRLDRLERSLLPNRVRRIEETLGVGPHRKG